MKTHIMTRIPAITLAIMLVASLTGAAHSPSAVLVACHFDFNKDTVGQSPSESPPGNPEGDSASNLGDMGTATVVASLGSLTDQPVLLERASGIGWFHFRFNLDPDLRDCETYTVSWRSLLNDDPYFINIAARSSSNGIMASVQYYPDGVLSQSSAGTLDVSWAYWTDQVFEFTMDNAANTFSLSIDGVPVPNVQDVQGSPGPFESLSFEFGGVVAASIVVDDVHVVGDCPNVGVRTITWGSLKSRYR